MLENAVCEAVDEGGVEAVVVAWRNPPNALSSWPPVIVAGDFPAATVFGGAFDTGVSPNSGVLPKIEDGGVEPNIDLSLSVAAAVTVDPDKRLNKADDEVVGDLPVASGVIFA